MAYKLLLTVQMIGIIHYHHQPALALNPTYPLSPTPRLLGSAQHSAFSLLCETILYFDRSARPGLVSGLAKVADMP